ncbi:MAG: MBL fold metallo-hydrolase, partial [bacterium]
SNADLDHVLGLFILREGAAIHVHAPAAVRRALDRGLRLSEVLSHYGGLRWHEPPTDLRPLLKSDGAESGLLYQAFEVPGKLPRYADGARESGSTVGYLLFDPGTRGRLAFIPDLASLTDELISRLKDCNIVLVDGTFFDDDEMVKLGISELTASRMAHLPVGGPAGSLEALRGLPAGRMVYLHINNTNPILCDTTAESGRVRDAGVTVGVDGMEFLV